MKEQNERCFKICSAILLSLSLVYSLFVMLRIWQTGAAFRQMFLELNFPLPFLTGLALSPAFTWTVPLLALANIAKEFLIRNRITTMIANGVCWAIVIALHQVYVMAVFHPLLRMIQAMG